MATLDYPRDGLPAAPDSATLLRANLNRLSRRRNQRQVRRALVDALNWGFALAVLPVLAYRLYLVDGPWWVPILPIAVAGAIGLRNGLAARGGPFDAALDADRQLNLQDLLSSGLAFVAPEAVHRAPRHALSPARGTQAWRNWLSSPSPAQPVAATAERTELVPALVSDATRSSLVLNPRALYPVHFEPRGRRLAMWVALLAVCCMMPNLEWLHSAEQRALTRTLGRQGQRLEVLAKVVHDRHPSQIDPEVNSLSRRMALLGRRMERAHMSQKESLVALGQLHRDLDRALGNGQQSSAGLQPLQQALQTESMNSDQGRAMQQQLNEKNYDGAARAIEKMADALEKDKLSPQERQKAAGDLQKMAHALRKAGGEQNQKAADRLEQAARCLSKKPGQGSKSGQAGGQGQQPGSKGDMRQGSGDAGALRQLANGLRTEGTQSVGSLDLHDMLRQIREAERDTGQNSGDQGDAAMLKKLAQSQCHGNNCNGQGLDPYYGPTDPHGAVEGGAGLGPRDHAQGNLQGGGVSKSKSRHIGDDRRWQDVWSDRLPKTQDKISRITGKLGAHGEIETLPTRTQGQGGPVKTPYYAVYQSYRKDAEDAVSKDAVPPAYKQPVKDYFDSIQPSR